MRTEVPWIAPGARLRLGGGFKEDPLRPVWSRHDHRIAVGGEQLAFQLVLLIGLIPVDVKEQYQSEWGSVFGIAASPARAHGPSRTGHQPAPRPTGTD